MDERNLGLDMVRVTEAAALSCARWMGRGDAKGADQAAVDAMRRAFDLLPIKGTIVIGEGERDEAPMLFIGEQVGAGWSDPHREKVDIAVDPLEGTNLCATGGPNSLAVVAMAEKDGFLHAPDVYMSKIAVGGGLPAGVINLDDSPSVNLKRLAKAKGCDVSDLVACILNRSRHEELIARVREAGARIQLITDGDVSAAIATCGPGVDILFGTGGAPEGVLAAAALRCTGGEMQGRLKYRSDEEKRRAEKMGVKDHERVYKTEDLAQGDVLFAATGVTDGAFLRGVHLHAGGATTQSVVMRSKSGTVRTIDATHAFERKPNYAWMKSK